MTDNEIIKALEALREEQENGYVTALEYGGKRDETHEEFLDLLDDTVALINRLQAENEALIAGQETLQKYVATQKAEIERLKDALTDNEYGCCVGVKNGLIYTHTLDDYDRLIGDISAEAIKEFADRLKEDVGSFGKHITVEDVDNLVKEMVGDNNG